MSRSRSAWLVSGTAGLLAVGSAGAADLPFRKSAPVDYVRVCDAFGQGFFYIPGTDSCLRISGQLRAENIFRGNAPTGTPTAYAYNQSGAVYRRDLTNFRARGYLNADARTQTAYGTLRTFVSFRLNKDSTEPGPSGGRGVTGLPGVPAGVRASTGSFQGIDPNGTFTTLDKGFIQFAGFTAGRAQSFFDFDAQSYELISNTIANSNQVTELFAYTATLGGGFSGTVSVEDRNERTISDNGSFVFNAATNPFVAGPTPAGTIGNANNPIVRGAGGATSTAGVLAYAGETIPDIVADVRYDGDWGSAQLSGAYHALKSLPVSVLTATGATVAGAGGRTVYTPEADGFAVLGGVKVLLPMLAKGDSVTVQGTYQSGAMDYFNPINYQPVGLSNVFGSLTNGQGASFGIPVNDAFVQTDGRIGKSSAAGGYAAFRHYFVPDVYSSLYGDYGSIANPLQAQRLGTGFTNARIYQVGFNTIWTPVKDFQIGGEVLYTNLRYSGAATLGTTPASNDDVRGRLSLRRAF